MAVSPSTIGLHSGFWVAADRVNDVRVLDHFTVGGATVPNGPLVAGSFFYPLRVPPMAAGTYEVRAYYTNGTYTVAGNLTVSASVGKRFWCDLAGEQGAFYGSSPAESRAPVLDTSYARAAPGQAQAEHNELSGHCFDFALRVGAIAGLAQPATDKACMLGRWRTRMFNVRKIRAQQWTFAVVGTVRYSGPAKLGGSLYVWRPTTQSVVGYLYDDTQALSSSTRVITDNLGVYRTRIWTAAGARVSGIQDGDLLCWEPWAWIRGSNGEFCGWRSGGTVPASVDGAVGESAMWIASQYDIQAPDVSRVRPVLRYRTFRSDDLSKPLFGPVTLEMQSISMNREGASLEAKAPSLNLSRTGTTYDLATFPMLRGLL